LPKERDQGTSPKKEHRGKISNSSRKTQHRRILNHKKPESPGNKEEGSNGNDGVAKLSKLTEVQPNQEISLTQRGRRKAGEAERNAKKVEGRAKQREKERRQSIEQSLKRHKKIKKRTPTTGEAVKKLLKRKELKGSNRIKEGRNKKERRNVV